jgi:hypothetical protein
MIQFRRVDFAIVKSFVSKESRRVLPFTVVAVGGLPLDKIWNVGLDEP